MLFYFISIFLFISSCQDIFSHKQTSKHKLKRSKVYDMLKYFHTFLWTLHHLILTQLVYILNIYLTRHQCEWLNYFSFNDPKEYKLITDDKAPNLKDRVLSWPYFRTITQPFYTFIIFVSTSSLFKTTYRHKLIVFCVFSIAINILNFLWSSIFWD